MRVNICGVMHNVIENEDSFEADVTHFGVINYGQAKIVINNNLTAETKKETLCHEMVHGMLFHLGYEELSVDEKFVQALGNAIYQGFDIIEYEDKETE